ncbi:Hypothetical protein ERGA_CDS_01910 [Ehrlichia ruminantium str. Gardel]|nr:Hypothetical protein ERGA_CDS_01910 [Ehrlichia ruminantium str. Gardel]
MLYNVLDKSNDVIIFVILFLNTGIVMFFQLSISCILGSCSNLTNKVLWLLIIVFFVNIYLKIIAQLLLLN